jgi:dolichyl-diphosphooligosaccharide--protein glycosyltransferase
MEKFTRLAILLVAVATVVWIRLLPLSLGAIDDQADRLMRKWAAAQVSKEAASAPADDAAVDAWVERHQERFRAKRQDVVGELKDKLQYRADDGRQHVYLGDYDSYAWLRYARNLLRNGSPCDAVVAGECRDTFTHAPVGRPSRYARSLHPVAIAVVHTVATWFEPGWPLAASSFLVPVLVGALGVFPAFAIGRRLAGDLGGLAAALLCALNPAFLDRSMGSDNDVWNVVLPLYMVWAALLALRARRWPAMAAALLPSAVFASLHAAAWSGWVFTYAVLLIGLLVNFGMCVTRLLFRRSSVPIWKSGVVLRSAAVPVAFYVVTGVLVSATSPGEQPFTRPYDILRQALTGPATNLGAAADEMALWPNTFASVTELANVDLSEIAAYTWGAVPFFIGWLGLLVLLLPRSRWTTAHFLVFIGGTLLYRFLIVAPGLGRVVLLLLLALPMVAATLVYVVAEDTEGHEPDRGAETVVAVWFLGALFLSFGAIRFVMLLAAPFGLMFAVAVGRFHDVAAGATTRLAGSRAVLARAALLVLLASVLIVPVRHAGATARRFLPSINDAWWETFVRLRDETPPETIVNAWWDYGYWIAYGAERRVSADGGSLGTRLPYWMSRALASANERESVGILRMLNCGSDSPGAPDERRGAYGKLRALGLDVAAANEVILDVASLDRTQAAAYLQRRGLDASAREDVLGSTHCTPPPSFLVLSSSLRGAVAWLHFGRWDLLRAYAVTRARARPEPEAVDDLVARFGISEKDARSLYRRAQTVSAADTNDFVAGTEGFFRPRSFPCDVRSPEQMTCLLRMPIATVAGVDVIESVVVRLDVPSNSRLRLLRANSDAREQAPAFLRIATAGGVEEMELAADVDSGIGILADVVNARVVVAPPYVLRSTFTRLMELEGRYSDLFEKFEDRTGYGGERVMTWRILWPQ